VDEELMLARARSVCRALGLGMDSEKDGNVTILRITICSCVGGHGNDRAHL
jgi:hypothetical protein